MGSNLQIKLPMRVARQLAASSPKRFVVQTGYGSKSYDKTYSFDTFAGAFHHYLCIATHSGYKKRLVDTETGKIEKRYIS